MVNIKVFTKPVHNSPYIKPIECYGTDKGNIYQQYDTGSPCRTYLISPGHHERPISLWYNDETNAWEMSSDSKKDLKQFLPHIKYRQVDAELDIILTVLKIKENDNEN